MAAQNMHILPSLSRCAKPMGPGSAWQLLQACGVMAVGTGVPLICKFTVGVIVDVGTGVTMFTGMISFCPTKISFSLVISFSVLDVFDRAVELQCDGEQRVAQLHLVFDLRALADAGRQRCGGRQRRIRPRDDQLVPYPDRRIGRVEVIDRDQHQQVYLELLGDRPKAIPIFDLVDERPGLGRGRGVGRGYRGRGRDGGGGGGGGQSRSG